MIEKIVLTILAVIIVALNLMLLGWLPFPFGWNWF